MLQVRVHGPGDVRVDEVAPPDPGPRDAVVRIAACGICGSDLSYIRLGGMAGPGPEPLCLGHEMAGVVDWVGDEVTACPGRRPGGRRARQRGARPHRRRRSRGWADPRAAGPRGRRRPAAPGARRRRPSTSPRSPSRWRSACTRSSRPTCRPATGVAVFGCGPIGLAAVATLVDRGHERVVAHRPERDPPGAGPSAWAPRPRSTRPRSTCGRSWPTSTARRRSCSGRRRPPAAFIEASGLGAGASPTSSQRGPVGGRLSVVALHYEPIPTSYLMVLMKQFTIRGSMEYPERFADAIDLLARRDLSVADHPPRARSSTSTTRWRCSRAPRTAAR